MFNKQWYFDIGATPLAASAAKRMAPFLQEQFGNPESIHSAGQLSKRAVETARAELVAIIDAKPAEIYFTSGATESDNWAIKGPTLYHWRETKGKLKRNKILISPIEHPAVREAAASLGAYGFLVQELKVDQHGLIEMADLQNKIDGQTLLVSIMAANNQFGTIQDLAKLSKIIKAKGAIFHTDAAVYFGLNDLQVEQMGLDLATISSPKIYGPKGIAALYVRGGIQMEPLLHGGGQERGWRAGTHNVPAIVGFAAAAKEAVKNRQKNYQHYCQLSDAFEKTVKAQIPGVSFNGDKTQRLVNNVHLSVLGVEGESLVLALNEMGICASSGSACSSRKLQADPALKALGLPPEAVHGSLRFFWHEWTRLEDVEYLAQKLKEVIVRLRKISAYKIEG